MAEIALFGGSFSPVHIGHMEVARGILDRSLADEVWMMPCKKNPLKDSSLLDDDTRVNLLRKAVDHIRKTNKEYKIEISDIEYQMPSPSYTVDTLARLQELYPEHKFRLAVGADSYLDFHKWKNWEWIESNFHPIVYPRPGYPIAELRKGWTLLDSVKTVDISSTEVRNLLAERRDCMEWMPWL